VIDQMHGRCDGTYLTTVREGKRMSYLAAIEHARACCDSVGGWSVAELAHNIESSFPDMDLDEIDDIAEFVINEKS